MATHVGVFDYPAVAAADYSAAQFKAVKFNSSSRAEVCSTAGERAWGILQDDPAAAGRECVVRTTGTSKAVAGAAVSVNALLTVDSSGRVVTSTLDSYNLIGIALTAASAAGDVIEVDIIRIPAPGAVVAADGFIDLPLTVCRELTTNDVPAIAANGGLLASDTTPILDVVTAGTDQQMEVTWAASNNDKIAWQVSVPPNLDAAANVTLHTLALSGGATDTPTLTWEAFFGSGDSDAGGASAAIGAALAEQTVTLAAANVLAAPNVLNVTLATGAHTTDTVILRGAWIEYTRK